MQPWLFSISDLAPTPRLPGPVQEHRELAKYSGSDMALHVYNPDVFLAITRRYGTKFIHTNRSNVLILVWESDKLPALWKTVISAYDVICTYSRLSQLAIEQATEKPVELLPVPMPIREARLRQRSDHHYELLFIFDSFSSFERKNPLGVIHAFQRALANLPPQVSARLRIKCHSNTPDPILEKLGQAAGDSPVEILHRTLSELEMDELWDDCDCYLHLHRSEGYGLPVAEALSRGIPTIATRQGGILDFTSEQGCFYVSGSPASRPVEGGEYQDWSGWIEPDTNEAASRILEVLQNYPRALDRARIGRDQVRQATSPGRVRQQLQQILGRHLHAAA